MGNTSTGHRRSSYRLDVWHVPGPKPSDPGNRGGRAVFRGDDDAMTCARGSRLRPVLLVLSAVLPVAAGVAGNQILNDGQWVWWWIPIAVAASAALVWITSSLTKPVDSPADTGHGGPQHDAGVAGQALDNSIAGGSIDQIRAVRGSLRLHDTAAPPPSPARTSVSAPEMASQEAIDKLAASAEEGAASQTAGGQRVSGAHAGGGITQIDGVGGDVTIERT